MRAGPFCPFPCGPRHYAQQHRTCGFAGDPHLFMLVPLPPSPQFLRGLWTAIGSTGHCPTGSRCPGAADAPPLLHPRGA